MSQTKLPRSSADSFLGKIQARTAQSEAKKTDLPVEEPTPEVAAPVVPDSDSVTNLETIEKPVKPEAESEQSQDIEEDAESGSTTLAKADIVEVGEEEAQTAPRSPAKKMAKPVRTENKNTQEGLISRTVRLYPSQIRALKRLSLQDGPDLDNQISVILRKAVDLYLSKHQKG